MTLQEELYESVVNGDGEAVKELTARGVAEGLSASELLNTVLIPPTQPVSR